MARSVPGTVISSSKTFVLYLHRQTGSCPKLADDDPVSLAEKELLGVGRSQWKKPTAQTPLWGLRCSVESSIGKAASSASSGLDQNEDVVLKSHARSCICLAFEKTARIKTGQTASLRTCEHCDFDHFPLLFSVALGRDDMIYIKRDAPRAETMSYKLWACQLLL